MAYRNGRGGMSPRDRAKQFMPFAALKGYEEALRRKEKITVPKAELSEERGEELDRTLRQVRKNDMVTVIYFCDGEYLKVTGMVSRIDGTARLLKIVDTKIPFEDLYEVSIQGSEREWKILPGNGSRRMDLTDFSKVLRIGYRSRK